jgi:uncharacterized protein (DUF342 family)
MSDEKKTRVKTIKPESATDGKTLITYNEIREGIASEINSKFSTSTITGFEENRIESVTKLLQEFEEDTALPTDLDLLYNFNASINITEAKWLRRYSEYSRGLEKNTKKLETIEAMITQKYKRDPEVHNGVLLSDKEIKNLIVINQEHIELEEKIGNTKAVLSIIEKALSRIDSLSYRINNAINTLKVKHDLQW